jgi:hypothetical protein
MTAPSVPVTFGAGQVSHAPGRNDMIGICR